MDKKILLAILQTDSMSLTLSEIQGLLNEELSKEPEQMDTKLIELCMDALETNRREEDQRTTKKTKSVKFWKLVLIAAVFLIFAVILIPVSAKYSHTNISNKIVQFYATYFHVDLLQGATTPIAYSDPDSALVRELQKQGFVHIVLPADLLEYRYSEEIALQKTEYLLTATVKIENADSGIKGAIAIVRYDELVSDMAGEGKISTSSYSQMESLTVNGLDVLAFRSSSGIFIEYLANNTRYEITLNNCSFEEALEIANSIG